MFSEICINCILDDHLTEQLLPSAEEGECEICGQVGLIVELVSLIELIHTVMERFYEQTSSTPTGIDVYLAKEDLWEQEGYQVNHILEEWIDQGAVESVRLALEEEYGVVPEDTLCMNDCPYDNESHYQEKGLDASSLLSEWRRLKLSLREQSRYFNKAASDLLDRVFSNIENAVTQQGETVLKKCEQGTQSAVFFRARCVNDDDELYELLQGLPETLTAPPPDKTNSGRMNASGVSVFYGALDEPTCIAELRPAVSSQVVVGQFELDKNATLLDLDILLSLYPVGSMFDDAYVEALTKSTFLKHLIHEIGRPVIAGAKSQDYLTTQFISEYLAQYEGVKIDGILYRSSQAIDAGTCVVFFHKSSRTRVDAVMEASEVDITLGYNTEDGWEDEISIRRIINQERVQAIRDNPSLAEMPHRLHSRDKRVPQLKYTLDSTKVLRIDGVSYATSQRQLDWSDSIPDEELKDEPF